MPGLGIMLSMIPGMNPASMGDPRPIASVIEKLERKHRVIITYEDAPYIHETEVEDVTSPEWRQAHPDGPRALIPKPVYLDPPYPMAYRSVETDDIKSLIQKLLDKHAEKNYPGRFRLLQQGEIFHIIPIQVRDSSGSLVNVDSILDTPISFAEQERTLLEVLDLITNAVSQQRSKKLVVGSAPLNLMAQTTLRRGANNEKARDILVSALKATKAKLSWRIFYDPGIEWYALNLHMVR
ncbi:MAG: hypothetical protein L0220_24535 [Acidobacteria bacterium]|nr:hypothetical protein [Acidobacteriota bacterium]